jgi:hypothetical protein
MDSDNEEYVPEFSGYPLVSRTNQLLNYKRKPMTSLDYMNFNSEEYFKYKLKEKIKLKMNELKLIEEKYINEICEICFTFLKKNDRFKKSDIIAIVTYKIIMKYNLPFSHSEIMEKLNLNKAKYIKFSKLVMVDYVKEKEDYLENNDHEKVRKVENFIYFMVNKLNNHFRAVQTDNMAQVPELKVTNIENILDLINFPTGIVNGITGTNGKIEKNENFYTIDNAKIFENIKIKAKNVLYNNDTFLIKCKDLLTFPEIVAACLIKHLAKIQGLKINLKIFKDLFNIPSSSISKYGKLIQNYVK